MAFVYRGRSFDKIGIIGSGQIGPDIALYMTKVFAPHGVPVVVVDVSEEALERGKKKLEKKVGKGVETGAFREDRARAMVDNVTFTADYSALAGASFVIEAATENAELKGKIFAQLEDLCPEAAIFASNSSHLEPEVIFASAKHKSRTMVNHFFFPAERNPMVEVVPGEATDLALADWVARMYEAIGKVPIVVGSRYGYAIDPIFEGLFQAAALCVEEGMGTTKEVDAAAARALGLGVGPFTAMNLTGGNPITHHGLNVYTEKIMPWFRSPALLDAAVESGEAWDVPGRGEKVTLPEDREKAIAEAMRGAYFGLCCEILDSGITNVSDLEMGVEIALVMTPPFRLMNKLGIDEALRLVEQYASTHEGFVVAESLKKQAATGEPWRVPVVHRVDEDGVAIVTIRRPRFLNALNAEVFEQLCDVFAEIGSDDSVRAAVLTGFGSKAFVSGADVHFLAKIESAKEGEATCLDSQRATHVIEKLGKPVVCALNGLAFGGGNEIAMACTERLAKAGQKVLVSQPEPNLGIIPGCGGTQRLPRWIGVERASSYLRTGRPISSAEAVEMGLVRAEVKGDLRDAAIELARDLADGKAEARAIPTEPLDAVPTTLPEVDLGHLSTKIDGIVCRAILEGARMSLDEGLRHEAKLFGECCETEDMRIGVRNFIEKGPRSKAEFKNA